ncbi:hypothetical protein [Sneathiella chinensis]|uniref:Uncharacterized protein n=1 Tax=Sneathiella chinensis TaxID=349750 RepID=A0ABQ5U757_9PROT|nr:hypothetical protein [Sneathiella chinensis]GLQ07513.1 hypothetical protein GCM10007924_27340 [Sneathiella chinensis]
MGYRKVQAALDQHLRGLTLDAVVHHGRPAHLAPGQPCVITEFLPGRSRAVFLGISQPEQREGGYRIHVQDVDLDAALRRVDQISAHFGAGLILTFEGQDTTLRTHRIGRDTGGLKFVRLPVTIAWRSFF